MQFFISGSIGGGRLFSREYRDIRGEIRFCSLNNENLQCTEKIIYKDPTGLAPPNRLRLTGACVVDNSIYVTTFSQILRLDLNTGEFEQKHSFDRYNDLHGIAFNGYEFAVANTGLDLIHFLDDNFNLIRTLDVGALSGSSKIFSSDIDYRLIPSTKPHFVHPNHCFWFENSWWVTRFIQKDAICPETGEKWDFNLYGAPHDGIVTDDGVYFTTIQGTVILVKPNREMKTWNLRQLTGRTQIGWGRGIMIEKNKAYIGFTKIRKSVSSMAKQIAVKNGSVSNFSPRILELDLVSGCVTNEFIFSDNYFRCLTIFGLTNY
ncbi:hypothetical protein DO021_20585 [Desulfobacter hydrogenophilus]|uniref:Uncharacterized protein n=1 Tax=Desulfobacter hydrogenophilus TaxID=2291 RepID=A0A328F934_9BACT|nr:hypothetical protein [Desulfobacter hydrogenophilus]NDY74286.1 hypothetical protein [Desulfobacter hydrogenophilus]QBH15073.1 hypothetical protein EYB58_20395 [Desulfobacter hydrogenophilus]RAM00160.1 hypothetical protein DO021_20585 [Desulfobacter hydrogenophilus]